MGTIIRNKVFETNSSSTHSISIEIGEEWDNIIPNQDGVIKLYGGEFGWEWRAYNDALTKANYCAVACKLGQTSFNKRELKEVIKEYTGATKVKFKFDNYGIDHQSAETLEDLYVSDLKDFIFNKSSYLYTGNDNSSAPPNFFDPKDTVYKYILNIGKYAIKFQNEITSEDIVKCFEDYDIINYSERLLNIDFDNKEYSYAIDVSKQVNEIRKKHVGEWTWENWREVEKELQSKPINQATGFFTITKI